MNNSADPFFDESPDNRLLRTLPRPHYYRRFAPERLKNYQDDLRPIYQNLCQLFDNKE